MKTITRVVWILSLVSLFTDVASEMLYPVIPIYLQSIHFSVVLIGVLEGFAEAVAGFSKGYFGNLSDNLGKRLPFVRLGYALSAISKPMMAVFTFPAWVFSARATDRLGKGIRTAARDAMLSDEATPETKGKVFGFHRSMDTVGAVIGPTVALLFLHFYPGQYKQLFYFAFLPGVVAIAFTFLVKEKTYGKKEKRPRPGFFEFVHYWRESSPEYRKLVAGLLIFALFNSSDVFLLLKIKAGGFSDTQAVGAYIFYNLVYAVFSYPLGALADRIGLKKVFVGGLIVFAAVYAGMAVSTNIYLYYALFFLYGIYAAATEGIAKAWISNVAERKDTATAIGTYTAFQSLCTLVASSLTGFLWFSIGSTAVFAITALVVVLLVFYFAASVRYRQ